MNSLETQGNTAGLSSVAVAGIAICFGGAPFLVQAQAASAVPGAQVVQVTALRTPEKVSDTVAEVTVLTREDVDRATGLTLTQLLAQQPGLEAASNGGPGQTSELFIRGLEARHTLLLLDGVRVGSATLGLPSFDNLPLALIDHIEIVRGPLSSLYGNAAAGGVVQVFTRRAREGVSYSGEATAGSLGYAQGAAGLGFGGEGFELGLNLQHSRDRGFSATNPKVPFGNHDPDRDGFRQDSGDVRFGWQLARDWHVEALALASTGDVHYDDGPGADAHALLIDRVQSLNLDGQVTPAWHAGLSVSRATDDYVTEATASPYTALGSIGTIDQQVTWNNSIDTPWGRLLGVFDGEVQTVRQPGAPFDVSRRAIAGAALALDGQSDNLEWQGSARRDHNSQFGDPTTGALALGVRLSPQWRLGASYGSSFVAPSFDQLYYPGYGNPALQPERGTSGELDARWDRGADQVRASLYRSRIRGFITSGEQPVNVPLASIDGVSLSGTTRWHALTLRASVDHLDPRSETPDGAGTGTQLPQRARNAAKAQVTWAVDRSTLGAAWAAWSHRYDDIANTTRLGGYATLDLFAERRLARDWTLSARMNNATGRLYETAYGYNQPGREFFMTLRYAPQ